MIKATTRQCSTIQLEHRHPPSLAFWYIAEIAALLGPVRGAGGFCGGVCATAIREINQAKRPTAGDCRNTLGCHGRAGFQLTHYLTH